MGNPVSDIVFGLIDVGLGLFVGLQDLSLGILGKIAIALSGIINFIGLFFGAEAM